GFPGTNGNDFGIIKRATVRKQGIVLYVDVRLGRADDCSSKSLLLIVPLLSDNLGGRRSAHASRHFPSIRGLHLFFSLILFHLGRSAFKPFEDFFRWCERKIRQHHDNLPVCFCPFFGRPNNQWRRVVELLLKPIMRMHPVSAALFEWKVVTKRFAGRDRILCHEGHTIHEVWQNQPVPMKARWHLKLVHHFHVKAVILFWRKSLRAIGLLDRDDGYLFAQDF